MTHPRDYLPVLDEIEAALEASCGALMTLQHLDAEIGDRNGQDSVHRHVVRALHSLRVAIEELRSAQSTGESGLALGFVLASSRPAASRAGGQSRPRRTA